MYCFSKKYFSKKKHFSFQNNFPFKTNLVSEKVGKIIFPKKFPKKFQKTIPKFFEYFFPKKFCLKKNVFKKFQKDTFVRIFFVWETRFGPFLPQIGVKKISFEKNFLKEKSEKIFFSKIISKSFQEKFQKNILF